MVQGFLDKLAGLTGRLARGALWVAGFCLVAMTALVLWQVFTRFVLNNPSQLTEPYAVLLMSWFIFLGAAIGTKEGFHMSFDVLAHSLPPRLRWLPESLSDLIVLVFGLGMAFWGFQLVASGWDSTIPLVGLPDGVSYIPLVAGGLLFALFAFERILRRSFGQPLVAQALDQPDTETPIVTEA